MAAAMASSRWVIRVQTGGGAAAMAFQVGLALDGSFMAYGTTPVSQPVTEVQSPIEPGR
jgi:hypothetical protein